MELHQLRYFVTVAQEGTFTRAAERLYLAQPSLSEQIRKLEGELGCPLFERLGRTLAVTSAGEALLPHAQRILFEVEQARLRVQDVRGLRRGRLSIGVLPSAGARLLPRFLAEFRRRHPRVDVVLREDNVSAELEDLVNSGFLDLAIIRLPARRPGLAARLLVREPMVLLMPPGHRLAGRRALTLREVALEPFVAMRTGSGLRDLLEAVCWAAGFEPHVAVEAGQLGSVQALVLAGMGVTVLPEMASGSEGRRVRVRDAHAFRELGVVWRHGQPLAPAASAFLELLDQPGPVR